MDNNKNLLDITRIERIRAVLALIRAGVVTPESLYPVTNEVNFKVAVVESTPELLLVQDGKTIELGPELSRRVAEAFAQELEDKLVAGEPGPQPIGLLQEHNAESK
jgi:hypothetical protein